MPDQRSVPKRSSRPGPVAKNRADPAPPSAPVAEPLERRDPTGQGLKRSRLGDTWVGIAVGALVLVLLIIFIMQNTVSVDVAFLGLSGSAPLAVMLLIAGVGFAIVTLVVGSLRIGQLRHRITQGRPTDTTR